MEPEHDQRSRTHEARHDLAHRHGGRERRAPALRLCLGSLGQECPIRLDCAAGVRCGARSKRALVGALLQPAMVTWFMIDFAVMGVVLGLLASASTSRAASRWCLRLSTLSSRSCTSGWRSGWAPARLFRSSSLDFCCGEQNGSSSGTASDARARVRRNLKRLDRSAAGHNVGVPVARDELSSHAFHSNHPH